MPKYTQDDLDDMVAKGHAMPGPDGKGSYPIRDEEDLKNAIHAVGRGSADHDSIRAHIIKRAKALNLMSLIPANWNDDGSLADAKATPPLDVRKRRAEATQGGREVRRLDATRLEARDGGASGLVTFDGLASRTARAYDMGSFRETIQRGAFGETLKRNPDVQLLVNHDGLPLARTTIPAGQPGALTLRETDDGLEFSAQCDPADPDVQAVMRKVKAGLMSECSFAFRVMKQSWQWMEDTGLDHDLRDIGEVSLDRGDVSICNYGANPATAISARLAEMSEVELRSHGLQRADSGGAMAVAAPGNPGCGCCPDCKGGTPPGAQSNVAPCHETPEAPEANLDRYKARVYTLKLKG